MLGCLAQTLYFAPFLSFAVQTKRNTAAFRFSTATCFEVSFRPMAKEARVGLLAFRMLCEGADRFTINISQFSRIFPTTDKIKHEKVTLLFTPFVLFLPPYFDYRHVFYSNQSLLRIGLEPAIKERSCHFFSLFLSVSLFITHFRDHFHYFLLQKIDTMAGIDTPSTVSVQITSSMASFTSEKRLQRNETISTLKVSTYVLDWVFELGNFRKLAKICFFTSLINFSFHLFRLVVRIASISLGN